MCRLLWCLPILLVLPRSAWAGEPPTLQYLFPVAGEPGGTVVLQAGGKLEPWPPQAWSDPADLTFRPQDEKGKWTVEIPDQAEPGPRWVRFFNEQGVSDPVLFLVQPGLAVAEQEPNNAPEQAQALGRDLRAVDGRLEKTDDVDVYALELKPGETLTAGLVAYALDAPLDPLLFLHDGRNAQVAFVHDGQWLDPILVHQSAEGGTYLLKVAAFGYPPNTDVRFAGKDSGGYRLSIEYGPPTAPRFPEPRQAGSQVTWEERGEDQSMTLPAMPCAVRGRLRQAGEADRYVWSAVKDRSYHLEVRAGRLGWPVDPVLRVEDVEGKELARDDDGGGKGDPELNWKAPADGAYFLVVTDLYGQGGWHNWYQLELSESRVLSKAEVTSHTLRVTPGQGTELKVKVTRAKGDQAKLKLRVEGLPEGVTGEAGEVPDKSGEVTLQLQVAAESAPGHATLRLFLDPEEGEPIPVRVPVKGKAAEQDELLRNDLPGVWLTVLSE